MGVEESEGDVEVLGGAEGSFDEEYGGRDAELG